MAEFLRPYDLFQDIRFRFRVCAVIPRGHKSNSSCRVPTISSVSAAVRLYNPHMLYLKKGLKPASKL